MMIDELMTSEPKHVGPDETLATAASLMWENDIGWVPVTDEIGLVIGVLTDRDICLTAFAEERRLGEILVRDAMTSDVRSVSPHDSIDTAERIMQANQVRRLPVVDGERRLIGVLSLADLARATAHNTLRGVEGLSDTALASTLAVISEPYPPVSFVTTGELRE